MMQRGGGSDPETERGTQMVPRTYGWGYAGRAVKSPLEESVAGNPNSKKEKTAWLTTEKMVGGQEKVVVRVGRRDQDRGGGEEGANVKISQSKKKSRRKSFAAGVAD